VVTVGGDWRLGVPVPSWKGLFVEAPQRNVQVIAENLGKWDTSLLLFLVHGRAWCAAAKCDFSSETLPKNLQILLGQIAAAGTPKAERKAKDPTLLERGGIWAGRVHENVAFIGECALGLVRLLRNPRRFRWLDWLVEMQQCFVTSLPIVSLITFLVGVILAFQAAIQLQQFGAAIYVADLVGLAVVREMGPMMAAVVVAGGTGASFAAQLGNMKVGEEMDALETLGISSVDHLALPRILAVTLMMPVLALYANVLGILGGMLVSATLLDIPASAYWIETQARVGVVDVAGGWGKSLWFGLSVGVAGCLRGMNCDRSAAGVGSATSSAVVTGILLIVASDAVFALIFKVLGI